MLVVLARSSLHGEIRGPSSKSVAQRLILATTSCLPGRCTLSRVLMSDDVEAALRFVSNLGIEYEQHNDKLVLEIPDELALRDNVINLGDSGTTYRIALGIAATLDRELILECGETLRRRPIGDLVEALRKLGAKIRYLEEVGHPPVAVRGPVQGGKIEITGRVSSQYISALMYAGIRSRDGIEVKVTPPVVSKSYIYLTANILEALGADIEIEDLEDEGMVIYAYPSDLKKFDLEVPADYALSAYLFAVTSLAGEEIVVRGFDVRLNPVDKEIIDIMKEMELYIKQLGDVVYVSESDRPEPIEVSLKDNPDLVMPVVALAVYARGTSIIRDVWHLAYKESNRLVQIAECIRKFGGNIEIREDEGIIIVRGVEKTVPAEILLPNDHRIAMMCSVVGLNTEGETILRNAECVKKSWPTYWSDLKRLGANIEIRE